MVVLHLFNTFAQVLVIWALFEMLKDQEYRKWLVIGNIFIFAAACAANMALVVRSFV